MAEDTQDRFNIPSPAVEPPNSAPTGSRKLTFTGNYAAGYPDLEVPEWLQKAAAKFRAERAAAEIVEIVIEPEAPLTN